MPKKATSPSLQPYETLSEYERGKRDGMLFIVDTIVNVLPIVVRATGHTIVTTVIEQRMRELAEQLREDRP